MTFAMGSTYAFQLVHLVRGIHLHLGIAIMEALVQYLIDNPVFAPVGDDGLQRFELCCAGGKAPEVGCFELCLDVRRHGGIQKE